jgi:hypothetical protein
MTKKIIAQSSAFLCGHQRQTQAELGGFALLGHFADINSKYLENETIQKPDKRNKVSYGQELANTTNNKESVNEH